MLALESVFYELVNVLVASGVHVSRMLAYSLERWMVFTREPTKLWVLPMQTAS